MALRWLVVAELVGLGIGLAGCEDAGVACGDPGGVLDIVAPADADAAEPDDGTPSDAEGDATTDPTCRPATPPTCFVDDTEVSCGIVVTFRLGDNISPRDWCEGACAEGGNGLDWIVEPYCWTGVPYCLEVRDLSCDDCCLLPWSPSRQRPDDGDPCTIDSCAGDTCTHEPVDWTGEACENTNDFGTCAGVYCCGAGCGTAAPLVLAWDRQCSAAVASHEVADGIDNDCDGVIDEAPEDAVFRFTDPGGGIGPAIVALDDGRFVVAWLAYQELMLAGKAYGTRTRMFVQVGTRQDPTGGIPIQVGGDQVQELRLFPLPQGRFALVWHELADPGADSVRVRVMRSPAEPELVDDTLPWSSWLGPAFAWPDGSFAVPAYAGVEGEIPPWQWMQRFDADGRRAGTFEIESLWGDPALSGPEATLSGDAEGRIIAAWRGPSSANAQRMGFWARWFDGDGAPLTDPFELTTEAYRFQAEAAGPFMAPLPDGRVVAGWSMRPVVEQGGRIRVRVLAGGALPVEAPVMLGATPDDGRQVLAGLGLDGDDLVATWLGAEVSNRSAGVHVTRAALPALDGSESAPIRASGPGIVAQAAAAVLADGTPAAAWRWQADWRWGDLAGELRVGFPVE